MVGGRGVPVVVQEEVAGLCARLWGGLRRPVERFIGQVVFGILAARGMGLSNIGRSVQEAFGLGKSERRLSRSVRARAVAE